ncbi:putative RNA methyltransferase [Marinobacter similis]|uniref:putative RNA methyltransferase n=1 Tax=Marinobacter similis TaxID=1420916 RepID=UPI001F3C523F|nr:hypothetical protein [Marinobacter similis]
MPLTPFDALACPLDGQTLHRDGNSWRCESGHSFDIARQGYVHLLPVQKKRSREPGDSKDMVAARQRFLNAGFYDAISDAVNRIVAGGLPETDVVRLLDAAVVRATTPGAWPNHRQQAARLRWLVWIFPSGRCWPRPSRTNS